MLRAPLWSLLVMIAGCTRGCPANCNTGGGEPLATCKTDGECDLPDRCHEGYCQSPQMIVADNRCMDTPECKGSGACRPGLTRSFLGLNSQPTCLVERDEDCAASVLCKTQGRCSLLWTTSPRDGYCGATRADHCASASRCASHDECKLDEQDHVCIRSWPECTGDVPVVGFDAAADLGGAWEPGDVSDALIACRIEDDYKQTTSYIRAGGSCVRGPKLGSNTPFLLRTNLTVNSHVEVAIQANPKKGTYRDAGYVRAKYTGTSQFTSGTELPKLTCNVVTPAAAKANADGFVGRLERGLVRLNREQASPDRLVDEPGEARGIRRVLGEAAPWLGNDPRLAKLQAGLETALVAWRKRLDAAIAKLVDSNVGPKGSSLRVVGFVCGDELKPRVTIKDGITAETCGVEVAVKATQEMRVDNSMPFQRFVRRGPQATVFEARPVDVHTAAQPTPTNSLMIAAGEEAIVLVIPRPFQDITGTRLIGSPDIVGRTRFVLPLDR